MTIFTFLLNFDMSWRGSEGEGGAACRMTPAAPLKNGFLGGNYGAQGVPGGPGSIRRQPDSRVGLTRNQQVNTSTFSEFLYTREGPQVPHVVSRFPRALLELFV